MPYQSSDPRRRKKRHKRRRRQSSGSQLIIGVLAVVMVLLIGMAVTLRVLSGGEPSPSEAKLSTVQTEPETTEPETEPETVPEETKAKKSLFQRLFGPKETEPPETEPPEPEHLVATATISATGDILMHKPVFHSGLRSDGSYDLDYIFQYLKKYTSKADLAVANLETTLAGTDSGYPYSGYPAFNCPDEIVDAAKSAGFDVLLTANNHCYDTADAGFFRTVKTVRSKGLEALGTTATPEEPKFIVKNLNGIKVGMACYSYQGLPEEPQEGVTYMNMNAMTPESSACINAFVDSDPNSFIQDLTRNMQQMRIQGAEVVVVFMHWGEEYQTLSNGAQQDLAQRIADLGVDVIVGGHPHVVQPIDLLTSRTDPDHKTVCLYSMGNAVSNQRIAEMNLKTGHTEDGLLFSFTFSKYSDGTVYLDGVDILPTWVDLRYRNEHNEYDIIPLDDSMRDSWKQSFGLTDDTYQRARDSYDRTIAIVGGNLERIQNYLTARQEQREADYLAAVAPTQEAA